MDKNGSVVTLKNVVTKSGKKYIAGRAEYVGCKGILYITKDAATNLYIGRFFTEQNKEFCKLETSKGTFTETVNSIVIETKNSVYYFSKGV